MGQRTNVAHSGIQFPSGGGWTWGYDALGHNTTAQHALTTAHHRAYHRAYQYDTIGNIRKSASGTLTLPSSDNWTTNANNQYTNIDGSSFPDINYDDDGNTTATIFPSGTGTLTWDAKNQLIAANVTGTGTAAYKYDPFGRRICLTEGGVTRWHIYDGWNLIAEYEGTTPAFSRAHTWGLDLSGSLQGAGGVGGLLSSTLSGATYYPAYDGNGNITQYLLGNGTPVAHYEYDNFGMTIVSTGYAHSYFNIKFSTKYESYVTRFYYYGYRYYSPWMRRWPSRDPIGERGGLNLYAMVGNDAVNRVDVLGKYARVKCNGDNIIVELLIEISPKSGSWGSTDRYALAKRIEDSISKNWNTPGGWSVPPCCKLSVAVSVDTRLKPSGEADNTISITDDLTHRDYVQGGNRGMWGSGSSDWTYAHEAGHLMGLPDEYDDRTDASGNTVSIPRPGHEGDMMAEYGGTVDQGAIDGLVKKTWNQMSM